MLYQRVPLETAGNGEDGVAHADFGHVARAECSDYCEGWKNVLLS